MKSRKRLLSILLTVAMVVMMMPGAVFAENGTGGTITEGTTDANTIIEYFGGADNVSVSGKTITLLRDVTVDSTIEFKSGEWVLNIGEYALSGRSKSDELGITPLTVSDATLRIVGTGEFHGGDSEKYGVPGASGIKIDSGTIVAEEINAVGGDYIDDEWDGGIGIEVIDGIINAGTINAKGGKGGSGYFNGMGTRWDAGQGGPGIKISGEGTIVAKTINTIGGDGGNFHNSTGGEGGDGISGYNGTNVSASILNVTPGKGGTGNQDGSPGKPIRGDGDTIYYTVNFENVDTPIKTQVVAENEYATDPQVTSKENINFEGWYSDAEFLNSWNFGTSKVTENTTLYAKWVSEIPGVDKVTVKGVEGTINGKEISVKLPYGTELANIIADDIKITPAAGAEAFILENPDSDTTWTLTVITGTTPPSSRDYTITISVADEPSTVIKGYTWTVSQSVANTETAVKAWIEEKLKSPDLVGVTCAVTDVSIEQAVAGTSANPQGTNGKFSFTVNLTMESGAIQAQEVTISNGIITATPYTSSGGGGGYIPPAPQKPIISQGEGYTTELDKTGKNLTITLDEDYELVSVSVNGIDKGAVTTLSGLKTGDKVEITVISKVEKIKEILASVAKKDFKARSQLVKMKSGKKAVMITIVNNSGVKFDGVEVYRSTKKNSGYGKKPIFTTKTGKYYNTAVKKGSRYYYKARGYMEYKGEKYYTDYSLKAWRMVK